MTNSTEQELAEYWAGKLGWKQWTEAQMGYDSWQGPAPFGEILEHHLSVTFFNNDEKSPIIAHLIQEYMEGEGYSWTMTHAGDHFYAMYCQGEITASTYTENKWLANATAAWKALEKGENK